MARFALLLLKRSAMRVGVAVRALPECEASPLRHRCRPFPDSVALGTGHAGMGPGQWISRFRMVDLVGGGPVVGVVTAHAVGTERAFVLVFMARSARAG
jgi:hypothetical protein